MHLGSNTRGKGLSCPSVFKVLIFLRDYLPELKRAREAREKTLQAAKEDSMNRLMKDLEVDRARNPEAAARDKWDKENEEDDDDELDVNIIDRSACLLE